MGLIKEAVNVDFFVEPRSLSDNEKKMISEYIRQQKEAGIKKSVKALVKRKKRIKNALAPVI